MSSIPTGINDRVQLKQMIAEMTHCLGRIDGERQAMKDIAGAIEEKFGIKKKVINKIARTMHKHNYSDVQSEDEHFHELYETVIENGTVIQSSPNTAQIKAADGPMLNSGGNK